MNAEEQTKKLNLDHTLIRVKDVIIILGAVFAFVFWFVGILTLPETVAKNEARLDLLEARAAKLDIVVSSMEQNLGYLTKTMDEVKALIIRQDNRGQIK